MEKKLATFLLLTCTLWESASGDRGRSCVDQQDLQEMVLQTVDRGPQRVYCPEMKGNNLPQPKLRWLKDCAALPENSSHPAQILLSNGTAYLEFQKLDLRDQGNYTCVIYLDPHINNSFTIHLIVKESVCAQPPTFITPGTLTVERLATLGSTLSLNCTAALPWDPTDPLCNSTLRWDKEGVPIPNSSLHLRNLSEWMVPSGLQKVVSSLLELSLTEQSDFGLYSCVVRSSSVEFALQKTYSASHSAAVIAVMVLLLILCLAILVFTKCHLNIRLWYKNNYGDLEFNDGKLYDAFVSYVNTESDRKFANFTLKPHLENLHGYKLYLNDDNILPGTEPSAELLMNVSRCRRLILVLSHAYLEQDWCANNFREGLWRLLELSQRPILITLESQARQLSPSTAQILRENQHRLTLLTWGNRSMTPSSAFWKELALAMPRKVTYCRTPMADPQTLLQDDKDPMLTLHPDYLDCRSDPDSDPAGDLGLRLPVYKALTSRVPILPAAPFPAADSKPFDMDISDLGLRNYGARTDFYCLVTEDDV